MTKLIFMHLPKTGGVSIQHFLENKFDKTKICKELYHSFRVRPLEDLEAFECFSGHYAFDAIERIPGDKKVFTFMREPKSRLLSLYYYWRSFKWEAIEGDPYMQGPRLAKQMSLLEFLRHRDQELLVSTDNSIARYFLGTMHAGPNGEFLVPKDAVYNACIRNLQRVDFVGLFDSYERDFQRMANFLGFKGRHLVPHENAGSLTNERREAVVRQPITKDVEVELERLTRFDQMIYEYARSRRFGFWQSLRRSACGFKERLRGGKQ